MQQTIEEIITSNPHVLQIIPAPSQPENSIDYTAFNPNAQPNIKRIINLLNNYLKAPCIVDDFQDHRERRVWREEMRQQYGEDFQTYYNQNSLRINRITAISINLEFFFFEDRQYLKEKKETFYELTVNVINACPPKGSYDTNTTQEKLKIVDKIKHEIKALLDFLPKTKQPQETQLTSA